jgi:hypothetical protein
VSDGNDTGQSRAMAQAARDATGAERRQAVADVGYHNGETLKVCEDGGIEAFVPEPNHGGRMQKAPASCASDTPAAARSARAASCGRNASPRRAGGASSSAGNTTGHRAAPHAQGGRRRRDATSQGAGGTSVRHAEMSCRVRPSRACRDGSAVFAMDCRGLVAASPATPGRSTATPGSRRGGTAQFLHSLKRSTHPTAS